MMTGRIALILLCLSVSIGVATASKITNLPGLTFTPNFDQYSGYITLDATTQKNMFYWFVESQNDPANDPLVLWLQGGPGCSGLIGFFQEHGPYLINTSGQLVQNPYSWNRMANMLYIESPVGVGFSYSGDINDYTTNDNQTAADNYQFLQSWLQEFPQFASNDFWITGESYAGVYGPMLANLIVSGTDSTLQSHFQGFSLGNPVTSCPELKQHDMDIRINTFFWNGLIGLRALRQWQSQGCPAAEDNKACSSLYQQLTSAVGPLAGDDLYMNFCTGNATLDAFEQTPGCITMTERTVVYMNRPDVQSAVFAKRQVWTECLNPRLSYRMQGQNMMAYYQKFFDVAPHLHILVYSGDVDIATVPHANTQVCLQSLDRPLVTAWKPWTVAGPTLPAHQNSNVTAGYVEVYDQYTFATVKGAGHEVPTYQPAFAYNLFERFIIQKQKTL